MTWRSERFIIDVNTFLLEYCYKYIVINKSKSYLKINVMISDVPMIIIGLKCILREQILLDNELENYSADLAKIF